MKYNESAEEATPPPKKVAIDKAKQKARTCAANGRRRQVTAKTGGRQFIVIQKDDEFKVQKFAL